MVHLQTLMFGGGVIASLHIADICDIRLNSPKDVFSIGETVTVEVKHYFKDTGRIELSYKRFMPKFESEVKKIQVGDLVEGVITYNKGTCIYVRISKNLMAVCEHVQNKVEGDKVIVKIKVINLETKKVKGIIVG